NLSSKPRKEQLPSQSPIAPSSTHPAVLAPTQLPTGDTSAALSDQRKGTEDLFNKPTGKEKKGEAPATISQSTWPATDFYAEILESE
ncbi:MAG: hypothetical protein Q9176_004894, partial [Flavoplaca citrina]